MILCGLKNKSDDIISHPQKKSSVICKNYFVDVFSQVKSSLDISTVTEHYGVQVNSKSFALCPFHGEKTPSFKINNTNDTFHCFGCGKHGTVIDFVAKMFSLTSIEAVKKLNQDFGLNLSLDGNVELEGVLYIKENKNIIDDFKDWEKKAFKTVVNYYKALRFWGEQIFIHKIKYFNRYLEDIENIVFVEMLVDMMIYNTNDFQAQVEFYMTFGEAVAAIERRLE